MIDVRSDAGVKGVSARWVRKVVGRTLSAQKKKRFSVGVLLTTDRGIRKVHKDYLKDDTPTDVISFGLEKDRGDLVVSVDTARRYARTHGIAFREELARYLVHGTLHLLGYEDESPRKRARMHERQEQILEKVF